VQGRNGDADTAATATPVNTGVVGPKKRLSLPAPAPAATAR
jgi:hypothetical protein